MSAVAEQLEERAISPEEARFHAERMTGIGGSDIGAILGLNPYRSAFAVWLEKTGSAEPEDLSTVEEVEWGRLLEEPVARKYARETGRRIRRVNEMIRHPDMPFAIAHPDRLIIGEPGGLEVKTAGYWAAQSDAWGERWTDQVPFAYGAQCQWYMGVTGRRWWDVAALLGGNRYRPFHLERDEDLIALLFSRAAEFWHHVETRTVPPVSASVEEALQKWPDSEPTPIEATEEIARVVIAYHAAKAAERNGAAEAERLAVQIADYMREHDTLTWRGEPVHTYKTQSTGERIASKEHAAEQPDCHARYIRKGSTRVHRSKKEIVI